MAEKKIDFARIADFALPHIRDWLPSGKKEGDEWVARNPTRTDDKPGSFKINLKTGKWGDFATGENGGDAVSLWAYLHGYWKEDGGMKRAALELEEKYGLGSAGSDAFRKPEEKKASEWKVILPVPADAPPPKTRHSLHGEPSQTWTYRDRSGAALFIVCRYDDKDGGKDILPMSFCQHTDGRREWRFKRPDAPVPLYGLNRLAADQKAPVLLVEGEKCADAAQSLLPNWVVLTWPGGTNNVRKVDWRPLDSREVVIWRDNDINHKDKDGNLLPPDEQPGRKAELEILSILRDKARVRSVKIPPGKPNGWDVADAVAEGWTETDLRNLIEAKDTDASRFPFRALGFDHGLYYYIAAGSYQILPFAGGSIRKQNLLQLAPLEFWEREFPQKSGVHWDQALDVVLRMAEKRGPYNAGLVRGRGAWYDSGKVVLHLGDRLLVDGQTKRLDEFGSRYIYETRPPIGTPDAAEIPMEESADLLELFRKLNWEKPLAPYYLAGWCALAPICGALEWRPHLWLTGTSGSGKTWVQENLIRPLLGDQAIYALGESSANGTRQELQNDALPIIIDEAEPKDKRQQENIQQILFMARQSSSEGGGAIYKGTTSGKSIKFWVRSCFLFSSIAVALPDQADESRFTVVTLKPNRGEESRKKFDELKEMTARILTPQFAAGIRARSVRLIPVIRANAKIFSKAAAEVLNSQRVGDQIGVLLAGAFSLVSDRVIDYEKALEWLRKHDFSEEKPQRATQDEEVCLSTILQYTTKVFDTDKNVTIEASIGELVAHLNKNETSISLLHKDADAALRRLGLRVKDNALYISNLGQGLKKILRDTPWASNYPRMLRRLPYAEAAEHVRFIPGMKARATKLPLSELLAEYNDALPFAAKDTDTQ